MSITANNISAQQLAAMSDDGNRYELVQGKLRMMSPAGSEHGQIAARVLIHLGQHVQRHQLGVVYAAETGFLLSTSPDTVRAPDAAFVRRERLDQIGDNTGYLPLAPDLVVEVVSRNDRYSEVKEKALSWIAAGSQMVLVIEPATRTIQVYRSDGRILSLTVEETFEAHETVPGWSLKIGDLFA